MKTIFKILISINFILVSCINHQNNYDEFKSIEMNDSVAIEFAEGFNVVYNSDGISVISHSIEDNNPFYDSLFFSYVSDGSKQIKLPTNFTCQSTTHIAYLYALNALTEVVGLCGKSFLNDTLLLKQIKHVSELCQEEKISYELLKSLNTGLFFIYPFETKGKEIYTKDQIETFYIAEYLEKTVLARLEWIKLFGILTNKAKEANEIFEEKKVAYESLIKANLNGKKFILNLPYKETWYMPSSNSLLVNLISDAGLTYFYQDDSLTENILRSNEQVWNDGVEADYWIIIAGRKPDFSMQDLINEQPVYAEFKSVKNSQVIFCNSDNSDYFVQGVVEPEILLSDLLFATNQLKNHSPKYFKLLK